MERRDVSSASHPILDTVAVVAALDAGDQHAARWMLSAADSTEVALVLGRWLLDMFAHAQQVHACRGDLARTLQRKAAGTIRSAQW